MTEPIQFWGIDFAPGYLEDAVRKILVLAANREPAAVRLVNAYSIAVAGSDAQYKRILESPGVNLTDGAPLAACLSIIGRLRRQPKHRRVRGPAFFEATLKKSEYSELSHLFFGGSPTTIAAMENELCSRHPHLSVAGYVAPPFADVPVLIQLAKEAHDRLGGDIIWLGLGTPKQDFVAKELTAMVSRPCVGVGAAFDFLAGTQKSAPKAMQATGTEWLYRLFSEPRRLWRRYTVGNVQFVRIAARQLREEISRYAKN